VDYKTGVRKKPKRELATSYEAVSFATQQAGWGDFVLENPNFCFALCLSGARCLCGEGTASKMLTTETPRIRRGTEKKGNNSVLIACEERQNDRFKSLGRSGRSLQ
jgi:hypothetical protein